VRYSNLGYLVLGELIAFVTGTAYETHIRDELLRPLGMLHTGFRYEESGGSSSAIGYQRLPRGFTPLLRAVLPAGIVAGRQGRYVAYRPFDVTGAAYGGLLGGVADATQLALLRLPKRAAAEMRRVVARVGPLDVGLGWYRPRGATPRCAGWSRASGRSTSASAGTGRAARPVS
jgi:CubicO group peptidase (beta-lactamase class C family)